eukprot:gene27445-36221_t
MSTTELESFPDKSIFFIKHLNSNNKFVRPKNNKRSTVLVLSNFDPLYTREYLFQFVGNQLQHFQSKKFVHPFSGYKSHNGGIGLWYGSDGDRTSCYPFDYDPTCCLLAGGDSFFVLGDWKNELVWCKLSDAKVMGNQLQLSGFKFEIVPYQFPNFVEEAALVCPYPSSLTHIEYHKRRKIHEFLFPRSYLVDDVEKTPPHYGRKRNVLAIGFGDKTFSPESITQKMLLVTANFTKFTFGFGKNPFGLDLQDTTELLSCNFGDFVVTNATTTPMECLEIELDSNNPYFEYIKVQCMLSLQNPARNVKHICYLELAAKKSTGTKVWSIGKVLPRHQHEIGSTKVHVFEVEYVQGPLVFTGVGIDHFSGFVFQIARMFAANPTTEEVDGFLERLFYDKKKPRLTAADITNYPFFESSNHSGYHQDTNEMAHYYSSTIHSRKPIIDYSEIAVQDKDAVLLFQKLNFYCLNGNNPVPNIISSMLDVLERCFVDGNMGLIQSVIRLRRMKTFQSHSVYQLWFTFAEQINVVKQFILERPSLNMIECAILSDNWRDKGTAILVAVLQMFIALLLTWYVFVHPCNSSSGEKSEEGDGEKLLFRILWESLSNCKTSLSWDQCYRGSELYTRTFLWKPTCSLLMSVIAATLTGLKIQTQVNDHNKFVKIFHNESLFISLYSDCWQLRWMNRVLLAVDRIVNVYVSVFIVFLTFFLISRSEQVIDLVLNCMAVTFIVELDDELNHRDPVEIDDLVVEWGNEKITAIVADYIIQRKPLRVTNDNLLGDPEEFATKFLVLEFKNGVTRVYREFEVVDFIKMEEEWIKTSSLTSRKVNQQSIVYILSLLVEPVAWIAKHEIYFFGALFYILMGIAYYAMLHQRIPTGKSHLESYLIVSMTWMFYWSVSDAFQLEKRYMVAQRVLRWT